MFCLRSRGGQRLLWLYPGASGRGISGYNLDHGRVELSAIYDTHNKKVGVEQLYNPGEDRKSVSWREDAGMRNVSQKGWAPKPRLSSPGERVWVWVSLFNGTSILCRLFNAKAILLEEQ